MSSLPIDPFLLDQNQLQKSMGQVIASRSMQYCADTNSHTCPGTPESILVQHRESWTLCPGQIAGNCFSPISLKVLIRANQKYYVRTKE